MRCDAGRDERRKPRSLQIGRLAMQDKVRQGSSESRKALCVSGGVAARLGRG